MIIRMSIKLIFISFLCFSGCAQAPWKKFAINQFPDSTCWTGSEAGYEIYAWECFNGEHFIVYQWQTGLFSYPSKIEKTKCGALTPFEIRKAMVGLSRKCIKEARPWIKNV